MPTFDELTWREKAFRLASMLDSVLVDLPRPAPTGVVVDMLARALNTGARDVVAKHLMVIAPDHPNATHNGAVVMRFGRKATGWLWHPIAQHKGVVEPADIEWSVAPLTVAQLVKAYDAAQDLADADPDNMELYKAAERAYAIWMAARDKR